MAASFQSFAACRALSVEYKAILKEPVEGFRIRLYNENLFEWEIGMFGPPDTIYEGGYFRARMRFPMDYPYSPPVIRFTDEIWHPNIYKNGLLCISILHPQANTRISGELACERWNPTQTARTILLSTVSLLNNPNTSSPANPDAAAMYRRWRSSKGRDSTYFNIIRQQAANSNIRARRMGIVVPTTREEYCQKPQSNQEEIDTKITDATGLNKDGTKTDAVTGTAQANSDDKNSPPTQNEESV